MHVRMYIYMYVRVHESVRSVAPVPDRRDRGPISFYRIDGGSDRRS